MDLGTNIHTTYNGKLSEGRGNFVCISTVVLDLYFLWDWIGPFSRGSNHTCEDIHDYDAAPLQM